MMLAFTLTMPGSPSWNGRWSGAERSHVHVRRLTRKAEMERGLALCGKAYRYSWPDGWCASIGVREVTAREATSLRCKSAGFCGYEWMIDNLLDHGSCSDRADYADSQGRH